MAPNMNGREDLVLPPLLTEDEHDDHLPEMPSSPTSVCDTVKTSEEVLTKDIRVSPFKDRIKRRTSRLGVRRKLSTIDSNTTTTDNTKRKSVKFHSRVRFKHIKHIDDYTDREYFATWYMEEELQDVFDHCVDTVRKMVNGFALDEDCGYSPRGLEYKTPTGAKTRKQNKTRGIRTVLDEQERQKSEGVRDPERLARLYNESAADSRRAYRLLGMKDQEEARPILQSRSSLEMTKERFRLERTQEKTRIGVSLNEEKLHNSATSIMDEFRQSYNGSSSTTPGDNEDPINVGAREYRVSFGAVEEAVNGFAS